MLRVLPIVRLSGKFRIRLTGILTPALTEGLDHHVRRTDPIFAPNN
jgi:hypothetical protein